jgi:GTP cyclohydrolase I
MGNAMKDVQNEADFRNLDIDKVGVKNLSYPIVLSDKFHDKQHTVANVNMSVHLPHHFRGTHMSRFIEILNRHSMAMDIHKMGDIMKEMKNVLDAEAAHLELSFPYFIEKEAPVSKSKSLMEYHCQFLGSLNDKMRLTLGVTVPVITLCPCSKEISEYNAHNQRGEVTVKVQFKGFLWIEDIISIVESCASEQVYSLLKREDEKYITEKAYENAAFVEDVVRNVAMKLNRHENILDYKVEVVSFESIHNHDAYAIIEKH